MAKFKRPVKPPGAPEPTASSATDAQPKGRGRPKSASPKPVTPIMMAVRGKPDYQEWFDGLADTLRRSVGSGPIDRVGVFDRAVGDLAKALGYPPPPDRY